MSAGNFLKPSQLLRLRRRGVGKIRKGEEGKEDRRWVILTIVVRSYALDLLTSCSEEL